MKTVEELERELSAVVRERDGAMAEDAIRATERAKLRKWHAFLIETLGTDDIAVLAALRAERDKLALKAADRDEWQDVAMKVSAERDKLRAALERCVEALQNALAGYAPLHGNYDLSKSVLTAARALLDGRTEPRS